MGWFKNKSNTDEGVVMYKRPDWRDGMFSYKNIKIVIHRFAMPDVVYSLADVDSFDINGMTSVEVWFGDDPFDVKIYSGMYNIRYWGGSIIYLNYKNMDTLDRYTERINIKDLLQESRDRFHYLLID